MIKFARLTVPARFCIAGVLVALASLGPPASAKAKPVKTALYLHGYSQLGEVDGVDWFANGAPPMKLDQNEPAGGEPKSMALGKIGLNTNCSGLPLGFPTWVGNLSGTIRGDAKLTVHLVSPAGNLTARLWTDTPVFSCNENYIPPASEVITPIPAGQNTVEIVFPDLKLKASSLIMVELLAGGVASNGRVLYDATSSASVLEFKCAPAKGRTCTP